MASWVTLLVSIQDHAQTFAHPTLSHGTGSLRNYPTIVKLQQSWDFVPPEVIRPMATTTVGDIAVLARRLGMRWTIFKPNEDLLRAEGGPHVLSSVSTRGLGLVLEYKHTRVKYEQANSRNEMGIWTDNADKLLFGILPENRVLGLPEMGFGSHDLLSKSLMLLPGDHDRARKLVDEWQAVGSIHGLSDLLSMACPMVREKGSPINKLYVPGAWTGMTYYRIALLSWYDCVSEKLLTRDSPQLQWLRNSFCKLQNLWPGGWSGQRFDELDEAPVYLLDTVYDMHNTTSNYFCTLANTFEETRGQRGLRYIDLLSTHLLQAPKSLMDAQRNIANGQRRDHHVTDDHFWHGEAMHCYFDYIPRHEKYLFPRGCTDTNLVFEAWATMVFRGFLWHRSHNISALQESEPPLDSRYYRSQMPVYIG
ncbi:MAG: hypothetical protein M1828_007175 [Chrysothrix sp. TS-e1954]|nr:MAG: hypothetical protein M1828_007175 [Chrysothrix sp. TS-e1954]